MRITYRTLAALIAKMNDEQLDSDVTVEIDDECHAAELRIADDNHGSLDPKHPIIFVSHSGDDVRMDDINDIAKVIGLTEEEVDNGPKIYVTARQAKDSGRWDEFCEITGLNPWALAEGMDENDQFVLTIKQARKCNLLAGE